MHLPRTSRRGIATLVALSSIAFSATPIAVFSADEATDHDHSHAAASAPPKAERPTESGLMEKMQEMHSKMAAAKTPTERAKLMRAHMALMQSGMNMMQSMRGAAHDPMSERMDMMQMMMQMMMDRMSDPVPGGGKPETAK